MSTDMREFYDVFFQEAAELLAEMETLLVGLDTGAPSLDDLNAIFRAAHSIKGGAATFGFAEMTEFTHVLEGLLDRLRRSELALTKDMVDAFLEASDVLKMQLAARKRDGEADLARASQVGERLQALAAQEGAVAAAPAVLASAPAPQAEADPGFGFFEPLYEALTAPLPASQPDTPREPERARAAEQAVPAPAARREDKPAAAGSDSTSIRVNIEKVDQLINLVGELVITQAMLAQTASSVDPVAFESLHNGLNQLERNTRGLQEAVMAIRMMPIGVVYARFPRVVRDLADKLKKEVELKTFGEGTELDKGLIEKIIDPLTHLVRNSLDHGIEPPERRVAAGKAARGTISLRAFHQGGSIVIEVADDGAGLNRERILAKAKERSLAAGDAMSDAEVWQLIFEPGFSTAETVTDVSGRGVGMDVVKRNIQALGGSVEIDSAFGVGTRISIRLPLTLAILDGMSVAVGNEVFVVPLTAVVESMQPAAKDMRSVNNRGRVIQVRGEFLPVLALHELFGLRAKAADCEHGILIIIESDGAKRALLVDELLGQHQVVIKSLESNYRRTPCISGATIMGDGRVALILDVAALLRTRGRLLEAA